MTSWQLGLAVSVAGGVGAVARLALDGAIRSRWPSPLPVATMIINVSGSFALGVLTGLQLAGHLSTPVLAVLGTGVCGGFTTFSTATFETLRLLQNGRWSLASLNGAGTLLLTVLAAAGGLALTS